MDDDDPLFGDGGGDPLSRELGTRRRRGGAQPKPQQQKSRAGGEATTRGHFDALPLDAVGDPDLLDLESVPPPPAPDAPTIDLDLPAASPAPARPRAAPAVTPTPQADARGPQVFAPPREAARVAPTGGGAPEGSLATDALPAPRSPSATASRAMPRVDDRLPTLEVMAGADYGPVPGLLGAIPYVIHVRARQKELVAIAEEARQHRKAAEVGVEQAFAALGEAVLGLGEGVVDDSNRDAFEAARRAKAAAGETAAVIGRDAVDQAARLAALESELVAARREVDPHRDRENRLRTQLDVKEKDLSRARATLQRAQIELRNFAAHAKPGEAPERVAMLRADVEARSQEVASAEIPVRELTDKLTEQKRELALRLGRVAQLEHDIAEIKRTKERNTREVVATESVAVRNARAACAALGRVAGETGLTKRVDATLLEKLEVAEQKLLDRQRREKLHAAAIDAYDKPTFYRGVGLLGAAGVVIAAMVLLVLVRAIF